MRRGMIMRDQAGVRESNQVVCNASVTDGVSP
jgi:hypothetical protein